MGRPISQAFAEVCVVVDVCVLRSGEYFGRSKNSVRYCEGRTIPGVCVIHNCVPGTPVLQMFVPVDLRVDLNLNLNLSFIGDMRETHSRETRKRG